MIRVAIIGATLYALWRWVDWASVWAALATMSSGALLLAVALTFAHYALWLLASLPGAYLLFRNGVKFP